MAHYMSEPSRTFSEYLLIPGYTSEECIPDRVSLRTPLVKYRKGVEEPAISLNIPLVSAVMQSVSNDTLGIALAKEGGISFIYGSQSIESQAAMVARVKGYKAGFVTSASNLTPDHTLADVLALKEKNGFSTVAITDDGTANGKLLGIVTSRDYRVSRMDPSDKVSSFMTPRAKLITAPAETTLKEANDIIWEHKLNSLPIVDKDDHLMYFVFRKDYASHKANPRNCWTARSAIWLAPASTPVTMPSVFPLCWRPVWMCWSSTPPRATPAGRQRPSSGFVRTTATPLRSVPVTLWTEKVSASWPRPARTSSRSVSAAAPSASPVRPRASAGVRLPL